MSLEEQKEPVLEHRTGKDEWGIPTHVFEYKVGEKVIARGTANIISEPVPLVFVQGIEVNQDYLSKGFGKKSWTKLKR